MMNTPDLMWVKDGRDEWIEYEDREARHLKGIVLPYETLVNFYVYHEDAHEQHSKGW